MKKTIAMALIFLLTMFLTGCGNTSEITEIRQHVESSEIKEEKPKGETDEILLAYLDKQAQSNDYDNWTEVAECEKATETHLLTIAKHADGNPNLVQKIVDNNATTGAVMAELAKSTDYDVWRIVALSDKSNEQALLTIAKHADGNPNLAQKIADNPNITIAVLQTFSNSKDSRVVSIGHKAIEKLSP